MKNVPIELAAVAVGSVMTYHWVNRFKQIDKIQTLASHNRTLIKINTLLVEQCEDLVKLADARDQVITKLIAHTDYLSSMLDQHDIPVTEFDKIAMNNLLDPEK